MAESFGSSTFDDKDVMVGNLEEASNPIELEDVVVEKDANNDLKSKLEARAKVEVEEIIQISLSDNFEKNQDVVIFWSW